MRLAALLRRCRTSRSTRRRLAPPSRFRTGTAVFAFEVTDDGVGFDTGSSSYGTGLQGIADRLAALGGEVDIRSAPGAGTTVAGALPVGVQAGSPADSSGSVRRA